MSYEGTKTWLIRKPVISEKSMLSLSTRNVATFEVDKKATKPMIKKAVEELFNVRVKRVRTAKYLGKVKRTRMVLGRTSNKKRAFVELYPGEKISIFDQGAQL